MRGVPAVPATPVGVARRQPTGQVRAHPRRLPDLPVRRRGGLHGPPRGIDTGIAELRPSLSTLKFRLFGVAGEAVWTGWGRLGMAFPGRPGRWAATRRRRQDPSGGELVAGASALLPRSEELDVDAPGLERTAVAGAAAGRSAAVFHRPVFRHVLRVGVRDAGADRAADGVRDADRCWSVGVVVASPGAQVILRRPLVTRTSQRGAGPASVGVSRPRASAQTDRRWSRGSVEYRYDATETRSSTTVFPFP